MTRSFDNMMLSTLAALIALATIASAQQSGGASAGGASGGASGGSGGGSGGGASGGGGGGGGGSAMMMIPPALIPFLERVDRATIAHGTIMCLAFVIFFPSGSLLIRLGHFKGVVYVHAGIQMFAYMMALAGLGLGVYVANAPTKLGFPSQISEYHPIIGLTIISALVFQPVLGALHHAVYVRDGRRSIWSTAHVWWGRVVLTLAIIQGGLGLKFAANTTGGEIAYGVVAGLIWIVWLGVAVWHDMKKAKAPAPEVGGKRSDSEEMTPMGQKSAGSA